MCPNFLYSRPNSWTTMVAFMERPQLPFQEREYSQKCKCNCNCNLQCLPVSIDLHFIKILIVKYIRTNGLNYEPEANVKNEAGPSNCQYPNPGFRVDLNDSPGSTDSQTYDGDQACCLEPLFGGESVGQWKLWPFLYHVLGRTDFALQGIRVVGALKVNRETLKSLVVQALFQDTEKF